MKILIQVVKEASVRVNDSIFSRIKNGLLLYVSFTQSDDETLVLKMIEKLCKLRIFPDSNGKTNLSIYDINGEILSISQFTLYADLYKTNRPSFTKSLNYEKANILYDFFNNELSKKISVKCGVFGADMKVESINDGPFTIMLDSKEVF